jgi:hypothetical protein
MNVEEVKAYKCTNCGVTYLDQSFAEKCCKPKKCEDCGVELPYKWYRTVCEPCAEKRYFDKSIKMTIEEYNKKYSDNMVFYNDEYYSDIDSCLESLFDRCNNDEEVKELVESLEYIYGTECESVELDGDSIIEQMEQDSNLEDFQVDSDGYKELIDFLVEWNKKYGTKRYMQDKIAILIPKELREKYAK